MKNYYFKAETFPKRQMYLEQYWCLFFYQKNAKLRLALNILAVILSFVGTAILTFFFINFPLNIGYVACILLWAWVFSIFYKTCFQAQIYARKEEKYYTKAVGKQQRCSKIEFYENFFCFYSSVSNTVDTVMYSDIISIKETKHYCIIISKNRAVYVCEKAGFAPDSFFGAYQFLCDKTKCQQ